MTSSRLLKILCTASVTCFMVISSCRKDTVPLVPPGQDTAWTISYPGHFPTPVYNFENNPLTKEGFELGRKLFFDRILSANNTVSCSSCHLPEAAFAQRGHDLSHGIRGNLGIRNSQPIFNMMWNTSFFWDGGSNHIEVQPINPITHPDEMGNTLEQAVKAVNEVAAYREAFKKVFNKDQADTEGIMKALAQYMCFMISAGSKYDKIQQGVAGYQFSQNEERGYMLFKQHCNSCHTEPLFTDHSFRNNGLALLPNTKGAIDLGRGVITHLDSASYYKFRVPTLRNLKYTSPFMHDGRYETVSVVLEHYRNHVQQTPNLDPQLAHGIPLSDREKDDLLSFLNTLNDDNFVANPVFRMP